ncbi:MAG: hypothetical protein WCR66_11890 [Bacteroidota bacterium]
MKPHFTLAIFTTMLTACLSTKKLNITTASQGIKGYVIENQGNRMPMKGIEQKISKGYVCTIIVFEPTSLNETTPQNISNLYEKIHTKQVSLVDTDSSGHFSVDLPVGKYSLFIRLGNKYYANLFNQFNQIGLFEVLPNKYTEAKLIMNKGATF